VIPILYFLFPAAIAAVSSWTLTPLTALIATRLGAIDQPGGRKLHTRPIPRIGGVAVVAAAVMSGTILLVVPGFEETFPPNLAFAMLVGAFPIFTVSLFDDVSPVRAITRLGVQIISAIIVVVFGVHVYPDIHLFGTTFHIGILSIPITVLWIVGVTNAFNLADGLDGLSAGLALISAISFSALGMMTGGPKLAALPLVLVGALVGFLPFNLYPARVFLGDCGATAIGFWLACLGLRSGSALSSGVAILVPVLVLGVPIADTLVAVARRTVRSFSAGGHGLFIADRDHIHHRLLSRGLHHPRAVLFLYSVASVGAAVAVASTFVTSRNAALLLVTLIAAAFIGVSRLKYDEFAVLRGGALLRVYDVPVLRLSIFPVFFDLALVALALYGAIGLKFDDWRVQSSRMLALQLLAIGPATALSAFSLCGLYRGSWKHASVEDLFRSSVAVAIATALGFLGSALLLGDAAPVSLFVIYGMLLQVFVNGTRSSLRLLLYFKHREAADGDAVLIYGAGAAGALALREFLTNRDHSMKPVGFIDDDPRKRGRFLNGYPILGAVDVLEQAVLEQQLKGVVLASSKIDPQSISVVRSICSQHDIRLMKFSVELSSVDSRAALMPQALAGMKA